MAVRTVVVRYAADMTDLIRGLDQASKKNQQLAGESDKTGKRVDAMAAAGVGVALALGVAVGKFAEFDAQMSAVAANTGATAGELDALRDAALKAGQATQFSATEAAKGITELAKAGVSTADILGGGLTGALNLAAAGQIEVGDAAEIAATAMTQFKLRGDEVSHVADLLAAGANKAQGGVDDLGRALKQSGLVASQAGLSVEETTTALTAFASAGLIGSDAGTSFKTMLQALQAPSKKSQELMDDLGITAYNAGGSFVGLAGLSENLRQALKDLTPQQRNAALATIFGSDAVRAASVLYEQGADGINKWTKEVNQQGFAARNAGKLTDNFKGDLERLQGSLETTFIKTGSGANSVLRSTTQLLEGLVNTVGSLPGPVLLGAGAFAALALVGPKVGALARTITGPLTTGVSKFRTQAALAQAAALGYGAATEEAGNRTLTASQRISTGTSALKASVGGFKGAASGLLSILGGPWGIALAGATVAVTAFATAQANAKQAGQEFSDTLDQQTGALTEASRAFVGKKLTADFSAEDLKALQTMGVSLGEVTAKVLEGGPKLQDYMNVLRDRAANEGIQLFSALASSVENTSEDVERGKLIWQGYSAAVSGVAGSANAAEPQVSDLNNVVNGFGDAAANAQDPSSGLTTLLGDMGQKSEDAATQLKALKDAVDLLSGGELALRASQRQFEDSLDSVKEKAKDYTEAVKKHGKKSQEARDADRNWREEIDGVAKSTQDEIKAMFDQGISQDKIKAKYDEGRKVIEAQLIKRGLHGQALKNEADKIIGTRDKMKDLLAEYAKTPDQIASTIVAKGTEKAKRDVKAVWEVINGQPKVVNVLVLVSSNVHAAVNDIVGTIGKIGGLVAKPVPKRKYDGGIVTAYAAGGMDAPNSHVAEIALPGQTRMWNEPETKGEAYIPLANDWRRPRAKGVASETVRRLGGNVTWHATGSISGGFSGMSSSDWDYDKLAAAFSRMQMPNMTIISGEDARVAAEHGVREFVYARDNG